MEEKHTLQILNVSILLDNVLRIRVLIGFMASWFSVKILPLRSLFGFDTEIYYNEKNPCMQHGNPN